MLWSVLPHRQKAERNRPKRAHAQAVAASHLDLVLIAPKDREQTHFIKRNLLHRHHQVSTAQNAVLCNHKY
jgi:hypothetical protein